MLDLFGNDLPERVAKSAPPVSLSLIDYAAERAAITSGRPVSQERNRILHPEAQRGAVLLVMEGPEC